MRIVRPGRGFSAGKTLSLNVTNELQGTTKIIMVAQVSDLCVSHAGCRVLILQSVLGMSAEPHDLRVQKNVAS